MYGSSYNDNYIYVSTYRLFTLPYKGQGQAGCTMTLQILNAKICGAVDSDICRVTVGLFDHH